LWAIEGTGHYGAGLARQLQQLGEQVHEVDRTSRGERRLHGKDDQLDAVRAARSPLAREHRTRPRAGEHQEALRLLMLARRTAVETRKVPLVQLRSVIVTAPDKLREELRRLPLGELLNRCSRFRRSRSRTPSELATILVLRTLAQRIKNATAEAETLEREILSHVRAVAPLCSTSPASARSSPPRLIVTWSHRAASTRKHASPGSPASHHSQPPAAKQQDTGSTAAETANSTGPCTRSSCTRANTTQRPATTSPAASPKAKPAATPHAH
jgi:transposase